MGNPTDNRPRDTDTSGAAARGSILYPARDETAIQASNTDRTAVHKPMENLKGQGVNLPVDSLNEIVGVTRFELATTRPPDAYSKPG